MSARVNQAIYRFYAPNYDRLFGTATRRGPGQTARSAPPGAIHRGCADE